MLQEWHFSVSGRVQGVGYRYSVANFIANNIPSVKGLIHNLSDGRVEIFASGEEQDLQKLLEFCYKGPILARVVEVKVDRIEIEDHRYHGFSVE